MSDAASVGTRTGALVVGAPITTEKLLTQSINPKQVRTVTGKGGELLKFAHYTIEPILGRHLHLVENQLRGIRRALPHLRRGLEPTSPFERWILSPLRLPFRHTGPEELGA